MYERMTRLDCHSFGKEVCLFTNDMILFETKQYMFLKHAITYQL